VLAGSLPVYAQQVWAQQVWTQQAWAQQVGAPQLWALEPELQGREPHDADSPAAHGARARSAVSARRCDRPAW
jgi:hypothetical protein